MALKIGKAEIKTPYVVAAGATALVLIVYGVIRKRQASAAAAAAASSPSADAGQQVDPATGDIAGSAQDQADLAAQQAGGAGLGYGGYGAYGGGLGGYGTGYPNTLSTASGPDAIDPNSGIPYAEEAGWVYNDQSGTWQYMGTGSGNVGGGAYTTNAQWLQATETYFVNNGLVSDNGQALVSALGKYLAGAPVTPDQEALIQEATGVMNYPPVAGTGGYPPGIHLASSQNTPPPPGGTVAVPDVVGDGFGHAYNVITAAGLKCSPGAGKVNASYPVTAQHPAAGTQVAKGSTVTVTAPAPKKK